jgi:tRNA1Val (adenine37-N6)-methyltransferase
VTETFLGGRVVAEQPADGFRSGTDAVMLAAAIPARAGEAVLELGVGAGVASLCLAARVAGLSIAGVEIDESLAALARANATASGAKMKIITADIFALPPAIKRDFDQVICNPPFHGESVPPPNPARARALMDDGNLAHWLSTGLQRTVSGGFFTTILRTDRLTEALEALPRRGVHVLPLWPRVGMVSKRVIVQTRKGSRAPFALLSGLAMHEADGRYTPQAEAVLRDGGSLAMESERL